MVLSESPVASAVRFTTAILLMVDLHAFSFSKKARTFSTICLLCDLSLTPFLQGVQATYDLAMKHKHANTLQKKREIEKAHDIRYTVLLSLPSYVAVRFCLIDPMHNLLLGSARTFVKLWMRVDNVSEVNLLCIQKAVDEFNVPYGFGRLPCKIESRFANFKAEQWKNWILIYSIVCFRSVLSQPLYSLWLVLFVEACFCSVLMS